MASDTQPALTDFDSKGIRILLWTFFVIFVSLLFGVLLKVWERMRRKEEVSKQAKFVPNGCSRALSRLERGFKYITDSGVGLIGCSLVVRSNEKMQREDAMKVIQAMWNAAPLMRTKIINNPEDKTDKNFYFQEDDSLVDEVLSWRADQAPPTGNILSELEVEICKPFDTKNGPLFRVIVYDVGTGDHPTFKYATGMVMVLNHTIADGIATTELYKIMCCALFSHFEKKDMEFERKSHVPMPIEDLVPNIHFPFWFELAGTLGAKLFTLVQIIPFRHEFLSEVIPPMVSDDSIQPAPRIRHFSMPASFTSKLIQTTKLEKATFTGALGAVLGISLVKYMYRGSISKKTSFRVIIPVDLRKYFASHEYDDCIANYVSVSPLAVKCNVKPQKADETDYDYFWSMARSITREIRKLIRNSETIKAVNVVAPMIDNERFASDILMKASKHKASAGRIGLFSISNLGVIDSPKTAASDKFAIEDIAFGANEVFGGSIFSNNVATYDGRLLWNMCYAVHVVSDKTAEDVLKLVKETLNHYPFK